MAILSYEALQHKYTTKEIFIYIYYLCLVSFPPAFEKSSRNHVMPWSFFLQLIFSLNNIIFWKR